MQKLKRVLDRILEWVCIALFAVMIIVGTYQIVTRYFFNAPSTISEELLTYTFTWMALLAAAYVFGKRDHMRMSFVADKFSDKGQLVLSLAGELIILLFAVFVLGYGGISITQLTATQQSASLGVPMGYIYSVLPVCGLFTLLYNIINISNLCLKYKELSKSQ